MSGLLIGWATATIPDLVGPDGVFSDGDWVESKDQDPDGEVRLTQLADVGEGVFRNRSKRCLTRVRAAELRCTYLEVGDVLVARMPDPLGRACLFPGVGQPAVTAVDVCVIRLGTIGADPRWLMWMINAPRTRREILELQAGTTRKRISRKNLSTILLSVPPLNEQRRIVAAIEEHFSRLDAADAALAAATHRVRALQRGVVIGSIGDGWPHHRIGDLGNGIRHALAIGPFGSNLKVSDYTETGVPLVFVRDIRSGAFGRSGTRFVSAEKARELSAHLVRAGDVLVTKMGDPPGDAAVYPQNRPDAILTADCIKVSPSDEVLSPFLALTF